MTVAFDGTRITDADALTEATYVAGEWEDIGGGAASLETDFFYQGSYSISEQAKTSENGTCFVPNSTTYNVTANDYLFLLKGIVTTSGLLATTRATGQKFEIGSGGVAATGARQSCTDYYQYYTYYSATYPPLGGWIINLFDPQEIGFVDNSVGTISLTAVNYWGHCATMTGSVKSQNVAFDAIEYLTRGQGLTWTGSGGTFQEFVDFDEGTTTNRYGVVTSKSGVLYCVAFLNIGTATSAVFNDSNVSVVWPWTYVGAGALGVKVDLQNASTDVDLSVCSFTGKGQAITKRFFDTALEINATTDEITVTAHGWQTGDYVIYSKEGGSHTTGLTDATGYYVYVVDDDSVEIYNTRVNAFGGPSGTGEQALTAGSAPGENHSLILDVDNRPDFTVSGTSGDFDTDACIFSGIRIFTLTSAATLIGGFIQRVGNIVASTGTITGAAVSDATTTEGVALFTGLSTTSNITQCEFTAGSFGHVFEVTSTGSMDSNANTYTGYWSPSISGSDNGWEFNASTGVDGGTETITTDAAHGLVDGDAVYYSDEGGTAISGLTDQTKYYVNAPSTTTLTMHATKAAAVAGSSKINITAGSDETHAIYGAHAVVYNNSGGSVTINVTNDGDTPSVRNAASCTTTVQNTKTLTVTCKLGATAIQGIRVRVENQSTGALIMQGTTDASGQVQITNYAYTAPEDVNVIARLKGYQPYTATDQITSSGLSHAAAMQVDTNIDLP